MITLKYTGDVYDQSMLTAFLVDHVDEIRMATLNAMLESDEPKDIAPVTITCDKIEDSLFDITLSVEHWKNWIESNMEYLVLTEQYEYIPKAKALLKKL